MRSDTFLLLRRAGQLKRLHTVPTVGEHTLARHVYGSQVLARVLCHRNPEARRGNVLEALLLHDAAELDTGDVPAPAKRKSPMLNAALHKLEREFDEEYETAVALNPLEADIVKACDTLDLGYACLEERMLGNRTPDIAMVFLNVLDYIKAQYHVIGVRDLADGMFGVWKELA